MPHSNKTSAKSTTIIRGSIKCNICNKVYYNQENHKLVNMHVRVVHGITKPTETNIADTDNSHEIDFINKSREIMMKPDQLYEMKIMK